MLLIEYQGLHLSFYFQWLMMKDHVRETMWPSRHAASGDAIDNEVGGAWDASATVARVCVDFW